MEKKAAIERRIGRSIAAFFVFLKNLLCIFFVLVQKKAAIERRYGRSIAAFYGTICEKMRNFDETKT